MDIFDRRQKAKEEAFEKEYSYLTKEELDKLEKAFPVSQSSTPGTGEPFKRQNKTVNSSLLIKKLLVYSILNKEIAMNLIEQWQISLREIAIFEGSYCFRLPPEGDFEGEPGYIGNNSNISKLYDELEIAKEYIKEGLFFEH